GTRQRYARAAGLFYLLVLAFDIAGLVLTSSIAGGSSFAQKAANVAGSESLYRLGVCLALLGSLSPILLAIGLYVTVKPADGNLAMTALLFRSAEAAIGAVGVAGSFAVLQTYLEAVHATAFTAHQPDALIALAPVGASVPVAAILVSVGA